MNKKDRIIFSKNPAPTDCHAQYFYKRYLRFKRDIVKSRGDRVYLQSEGGQPVVDARVSFKKTRTGVYIPMLTMPLTLRPIELERIQIYEYFFPLYLRLRTLLLTDMHNKLGPDNTYYHDRGPTIWNIRDRMGALNLLCALMYARDLNLHRLEIIAKAAGGETITATDCGELTTLSKTAKYHSKIAWSFSNDYRISDGDLFGEQQNSWWCYVRKFYPYIQSEKISKYPSEVQSVKD